MMGDYMDEWCFATMLFTDGDVDVTEARQSAAQQRALLLAAGQRGHQRGRQADQQTNARYHSRRRGSRGKGISHTAERYLEMHSLCADQIVFSPRVTHNACLHFLSGSSLLQSALCTQ